MKRDPSPSGTWQGPRLAGSQHAFLKEEGGSGNAVKAKTIRLLIVRAISEPVVYTVIPKLPFIAALREECKPE